MMTPLTILCLIISTTMSSTVSLVTIEEGLSATLNCPGYTPNPAQDAYAVFRWYKAKRSDASNENRVIFYSRGKGYWDTSGNLAGRVSLDEMTGALVIARTTIQDDHHYTCLFRQISSGTLKSETQLSITVTPSESDLKVSVNPPGPVQQGESVTFKCSVSRVRPPPREMYWQFADEPQHLGDYRNETNDDGLTSSASVEYTVVASHSFSGRRMSCHLVWSMGNLTESNVTMILIKSNATMTQVNQIMDNVVAIIQAVVGCVLAAIIILFTWILLRKFAHPRHMQDSIRLGKQPSRANSTTCQP